MAYPNLPSKLSDLLEVALKDLTSVRRSKRYHVNMAVWHTPIEGECQVCLAGAVMARTLGIEPEKDADPYNMPQRLSRPLEALNELRLGFVLDAYCNLRDTIPQKLSDRMYRKCRDVEICLNSMSDSIGRRVVPYSESPKQFVEGMKRLHTLLVDFGL